MGKSGYDTGFNPWDNDVYEPFDLTKWDNGGYDSNRIVIDEESCEDFTQHSTITNHFTPDAGGIPVITYNPFGK